MVMTIPQVVVIIGIMTVRVTAALSKTVQSLDKDSDRDRDRDRDRTGQDRTVMTRTVMTVLSYQLSLQ